MTLSESLFVPVRGLRYHVRAWGPADARPVLLLHGWMDVSASFQFLADAMRGKWRLYAPDWRGFGLTDWTKADSYWFPDYLADLDALLAHLSPNVPAALAGHSMGGNVACLYAGVRPERVAKLANLEGFGLTAVQAEEVPQRYARWLDEIRERPRFRDYESFAALAERLQIQNPRLAAQRAEFLARHWGKEVDGRVVLRSDPAHKLINAVPYRLEEAKACWRNVVAPVLWVVGDETRARGQVRLSEAHLAERKACFPSLEEAVIEQAGHMLHHDQPERLAAVLEAFLS